MLKHANVTITIPASFDVESETMEPPTVAFNDIMLSPEFDEDWGDAEYRHVYSFPEHLEFGNFMLMISLRPNEDTGNRPHYNVTATYTYTDSNYPANISEYVHNRNIKLQIVS